MLPSIIIQLLEENVQNINSFVYSNLLPKEWANQFEVVCNQFVDAHFKPSIAGSLLGVDEIEIQIQNLKNLKLITSVNLSPLNSGDYTGNLPANFRNLLNERLDVTSVCGNAVHVNVPPRMVGDELWENTIVNPFTKPVEKSPISKIVGNVYYANAGGAVVNSVKMTYIKKVHPLDVTLDTDWTDFQPEIILRLIDLTRNRILELVKSDRLPSAIQESQRFGLN